MKKNILSFLCLTTLALAAGAEDKTAPDNSKKNERDSTSETKTAGDQSNAPADLKLTADIRRAVVGDKSLSMTAKNVKIITIAGMVTLRGPVKTEAEKDTIAKLAMTAAGDKKVDNQLEVKAAK